MFVSYGGTLLHSNSTKFDLISRKPASKYILLELHEISQHQTHTNSFLLQDVNRNVNELIRIKVNIWQNRTYFSEQLPESVGV